MGTPISADEETLRLGLRTGLPDALRVLLEEYPRIGWETDPGYTGLVRFWLDRHLMFRRMVERLKSDTELAIDKELDLSLYRQGLARLGSIFVQEMHGHHTIEDQHYFPALAKLDHRIQSGFDVLDRDHHALDPLLNEFANSANDVLRHTTDHNLDAISVLREQISTTEQLLNRHLTDEEELVVPLILKNGAEGLG